MRPFDIIPTFLDSPQGRIFVIHRMLHGVKAQLGVVLVPPFAEEMNRSRHMLTLLAEALSRNGCHVLLPDFYGTGDSEGRFDDADWGGWVEQLNCCVENLKNNYGIDRYSMVGIRAGALLVADYLQNYSFRPERLVFWQPVLDGDAYLKQFLRLRMATDMLSSDEGVTTPSMIQSLANGETVEVIGYPLRSALTDGLSNAAMRKIEPGLLPEISWFDLVTYGQQIPPVKSRDLIQTWSDSGACIQYLVIPGDPFWNSAEVVENHKLIVESVNFLVRD